MNNYNTRSFNEILEEAQNTEELKVLSDCWKEIVKNKYKYSLVQIKYAKEFLEERVKEMARRDAGLLKPFLDALNGC